MPFTYSCNSNLEKIQFYSQSLHSHSPCDPIWEVVPKVEYLEGPKFRSSEWGAQEASQRCMNRNLHLFPPNRLNIESWKHARVVMSHTIAIEKAM